MTPKGALIGKTTGMQSGQLGRAISTSCQFLTAQRFFRCLPHLRKTASLFSVGGGRKYPVHELSRIDGCAYYCTRSYMNELDTIAKCLKDKATSSTNGEPSEDDREYFPFEGDEGSNSLTGSQHVPEDQVERVETPEGRFYHVRRFTSSGKRVYSLPSVTTILCNTRSQKTYFSLRNWRKNMIKEHGEEGYRRMKKETMGQGVSFHQQLERRLRNQSQVISIKPVTPTDCSVLCDTFPEEANTGAVESPSEQQLNEVTSSSGLFQSVEHVLKDISKVYALESVVTHLELGYTGTCDCVAVFRDKLCVIDWKTSSKPRPSLSDCYDFPIQAAAYAGAVNQDHHYPFKVYHTLIVVAYPTGEPAHTHLLTRKQCHEQWLKWLDRLEEYRTQFAHDLSNVYI